MTKHPRQLKPTKQSASPVETMLDRLMQAIMDNDRDGVTAATERLFDIGDEIGPAIRSRLLEDRSPLPTVELELLQSLGGQAAYLILEEIVATSGLDDLLRFEAQRILGWPESQQKKRRRDFLDTLKSPNATLIRAAGMGLAAWPPMIELLEEVLHDLIAMPADQRTQAVGAIIGEIGSPSVWLLRGLLHVRDTTLQRMILDQLLAWQDRASAGAVRRLAATGRSKKLREEAATVASRLEMRSINQRDRDSERPWPPIGRAFLSEIDGDGGQVALITRDLDDELSILFDAFHNEIFGIKDLIGRRSMPRDEVEEMLEEFEVGGVETVEVDPAAVRGALIRAVEMNARNGKPIPPAFELWEPLLHDGYPAEADEPVILPILDDTPYAGRADLITASADLFGHVWFSSWLVPVEDALTAMEAVPPPPGGILTDHEYQALIPRFFPPEFLNRLRERLRRQAWLLEREGEPGDRDLALAVAASFDDADAADLTEQPFLREMTRLSVENAVAALYWGMPGATSSIFPFA
ncbi:MAG TPA: hypothetical protein VFL82_15070 [Thermomicrobiales bacterium]|nr:hypothetical protein [Thermomicrobiales bacterium]